MQRQRNGNIVRAVLWVVTLIGVAIAAPPSYHSLNGAYQRFHFSSVSVNAMKECGGPITDTTAAYQQTQINDCLAKNEDLLKAKSDYAAFTKSEKR